MQSGHPSGAAALSDGRRRLLVRTLSLGGIMAMGVTAFYVLPSDKESRAPASAASSPKQQGSSGAAQGVSAQEQASGPRVIYAGLSVPSGIVPKPEPGVRSPEAALPITDRLPDQTPGRAPVSAASPAPRALAPSSASTSLAPSPLSVIQVASVSDRAEFPARQTGSVVNLNTATLEELNKLSGAGLIGRAIIRGRPYTTPEDLLKKQVLSRAAYARIKDHVAAR